MIQPAATTRNRPGSRGSGRWISSRSIWRDLDSFRCGDPGVEFAQAGGYGAGFRVVENGAVDPDDGDDLAHRAGAEDFIRLMDFFLGDVSYFHGDSFLSAQVQDGHAGDSFGAGPSGGRFDGAVANEEDVGGVGLGEVALGVEHEGVIGSGGGRFHLGEDGGELIAAVDVLVEDVGEGAPGGRGVEDEARLVVDGSLVLGEDEERTAVGVDTRIESGGVFDASRDGEANVDRVGHSVRGEGALELFEQAPVGGHALVFQEVRAAT
jgi:hypothetical protein